MLVGAEKTMHFSHLPEPEENATTENLPDLFDTTPEETTSISRNGPKKQR